MTVVSREQWSLETNASATFKLALAAEQYSRWSDSATMLTTLEKVQKIIAACDIGISEVEYLVVTFSDDVLEPIRKPNPYKGPGELAMAQMNNLPRIRPLGFLFKDSVPSTAKAYTRTSIDRLSSGTIDPRALLNTFFITHDWVDNSRVPGGTPSFDTTAHELAHLLGNIGHIALAPNLMSSLDGVGTKSGDLSQEQCAAMNTFPYLIR